MILTIGSGFLGSYILREASQTGERVAGTYRNACPQIPGAEFFRCDVTSPGDISSLRDFCGKEHLTVFYTAACHNVDYVYEHPEKAWEVNGAALERFLDAFDNIDRLLFTSTDCVYGENTDGAPLFRESDTALPVNEYGRQKLRAEGIVNTAGFTAARLPFMLGPSLTNKPHFYDKVVQDLRQGGEPEMIDGMLRSVLYYDDAARLLLKLAGLPDKLPPVVNVCGDCGYSKYETAVRIAEREGLDPSRIKKISEEEGRKFFRDRRAHSALMDNSLMKRLLT